MRMTVPAKPASARQASVFADTLAPLLEGALHRESPLWLQALRARAKGQFERLGLPSRKQEAWRYEDLRPLLETAFEPASAKTLAATIAPGVIPAVQGIAGVAGRWVFMDGLAAPEWTDRRGVPAGVVFDALSNVLVSEEAHVRPRLGQSLPAEGHDPFLALNTALFEDGLYLRVPAGVTLERPLEVLFLATASAGMPVLSLPRVLVVLEPGAKASLVIRYATLSEGKALVVPVVECDVAENASLAVTVIQDEGPGGWHLAATRVGVAGSGHFVQNTVCVGQGVSRNALDVHLLAEDAQAALYGLNVLGEKARAHHHTGVYHPAPGCRSEQVYKSILDGETVAEFDATIHVLRNAQGTDSRQLNKNLLLSPAARALTRPQLRIDADDVKCAHGATVGQLDDTQLFYLASRGIGGEIARCLLTYGFAEDVVLRIAETPVREAVDALVLRNLGQENNPATCMTSCTSHHCHPGSPVAGA